MFVIRTLNLRYTLIENSFIQYCIITYRQYDIFLANVFHLWSLILFYPSKYDFCVDITFCFIHIMV